MVGGDVMIKLPTKKKKGIGGKKKLEKKESGPKQNEDGGEKTEGEKKQELLKRKPGLRVTST